MHLKNEQEELFKMFHFPCKNEIGVGQQSTKLGRKKNIGAKYTFCTSLAENKFSF